MAPGAFLPLACTANLVKNLAAVSASTTRAPIYKTFARTNNLADVSSKVLGCQCESLRKCVGPVIASLKTPISPITRHDSRSS